VDQDLQGQLEYKSYLMGSTDRIWINHLVEIDPEPITLEGDSHYYLKGWVHSKARFIHLRLTSGSVKTEDRREGSMAGGLDCLRSTFSIDAEAPYSDCNSGIQSMSMGSGEEEIPYQ
jgi:hypothetical protein